MIYNCAEEFSPLEARAFINLRCNENAWPKKFPMGERAWREAGYRFPRNWQRGGTPSEDRSSMGRCREAGRPIKTKQKSAYLHKLAWQWTKIVDEDCPFFRITFRRPTVARRTSIGDNRGKRREKPLRLRCHRRGGT